MTTNSTRRQLAPPENCHPDARARTLHREDALAPLRHYARGYAAGAFVEWASEVVAIELEALALSILDAVGVPPKSAAEVIEQARLEISRAVPSGTSPYDIRALAAQRVALLVRVRLARDSEPRARGGR